MAKTRNAERAFGWRVDPLPSHPLVEGVLQAGRQGAVEVERHLGGNAESVLVGLQAPDRPGLEQRDVVRIVELQARRLVVRLRHGLVRGRVRHLRELLGVEPLVGDLLVAGDVGGHALWREIARAGLGHLAAVRDGLGPREDLPDVALGPGLHHVERHDGDEHDDRAGVRGDGHAAGKHLLELELDKAKHVGHLRNGRRGARGDRRRRARRAARGRPPPRSRRTRAGTGPRAWARP